MYLSAFDLRAKRNVVRDLPACTLPETISIIGPLNQLFLTPLPLRSSSSHGVLYPN